MKPALGATLLCIVCLYLTAARLHAAEVPYVKIENGAGQLIVRGQPFLILGGEVGNSSAGTAAQADLTIPRLAAMHVNTILMPVAWEQIEPKEGSFDFTILDHWIETARRNDVHLVLLWFGSWKNSVSSYAPSWVKSDAKRFPRAESADGMPLEILSTLSVENRRCDARAFAALMRHVREKDSEQQTVLMVQVENEVAAGRIRIAWRSTARRPPASTSTPLTFTGPTSNTGSSATASPAIRSSYPRRVSRARRTTRSMLTAKGVPSVSVPSAWTACGYHQKTTIPSPS